MQGWHEIHEEFHIFAWGEKEGHVDTEDEDSDEKNGDNEIVGGEVNIEFGVYSISDNNSDAIKKLLQLLFLKAPVSTYRDNWAIDSAEPHWECD